MFISDALSRAYLVSTDSDEQKTDLENESEILFRTVVSNWNCSEIMKNKIRYETKEDCELKIVKKYIENDWPSKISSCSDEAKQFF